MPEAKSASFLELINSHNSRVSQHYTDLAPRYDKLKKLNPYYRKLVKKWLRSTLPEGRHVIDLGCGDGYFLESVKPIEGLGVDISPALVAHAQNSNPNYQFTASAIEALNINKKFDAALMVGLVEYVYDIGSIIKKSRELLNTNGRIFIATGNPLWKPIFELTSKIGLRTPDCPRNYITNKDLINLLKLHDFEVIREEMAILVPKWIPLLGPLLNWLTPRLPAIKYICSTQFLTARKLEPEKKEYSTSIIIPCFNEAGNIKRCIESVQPIGKSTEIIFVDDSSTDNTLDEIKKYQNLRQDITVRHITYPQNRGKGYAVKQGFDNATGDIVFIVDADLTTHPEELHTLYDTMSWGRAEFINCTRMIYPMEKGSMRWLNYVGNKLFTILVSLVMEDRVSDTLCGTKGCFRKDYAYFCMGRDPWGDYDFLFGAAHMRLSMLELPVHYRERLAGVSKMRSFKHAMNLLKMCWHGFFQVKFQKPLIKKNSIKYG